MRSLILIILVFASATAYAQRVTVVKDPRIDLLIKKQAELNAKVAKQNQKSGPGYRVMVINTNDRTKAMEVKSKLMSDYPEHKSYLVYQSPYFKIQIGNFRSRQEAEDLRKRIVRSYPTGVMVVPATVEYKIEPDEDE